MPGVYDIVSVGGIVTDLILRLPKLPAGRNPADAAAVSVHSRCKASTRGRS